MHRFVFLPLLVGCTPEEESFARGGRTSTCNVEWAGRFVESAADRGIDVNLARTTSATGFQGPQTGVIAEDLDLDGDIDLMFWDGEENLHLYANDGTGHFSGRPLPGPPDIGEGRHMRAVGAGDLDGDGLHELVWTGDGSTAVAINQGGLSFSEFSLVHHETEDIVGGYASLAFGDIDGDGDLDVALAGLDMVAPGSVPSEDPRDWMPTPDLLLINDGGLLAPATQLIGAEGTSLSLLQVFTDRDQDGDVDLFSWSDRAGIGPIPLGVAWRNDGGIEPHATLIDDAARINADSPASAMGHASADLNGDQLLDYCVSNAANHLTCLVSDGEGAFFDAGMAHGLSVDVEKHPLYPGPEDVRTPGWVSWGVVMVDLDNDGWIDAAASGAPLPAMGNTDRSPSPRFQPTWLWRGKKDGFVDGLGGGIVTDTWAWGMVSADLDHDGSREIILATASGAPEVWDNDCTTGHWLEVTLEGPGNNVHGVGASVLVTVGDTTRMLEVGSLTTGGQSPAALHFGLGDEELIDTIEVRWPGGERTLVEDIDPNQHIVVSHAG